MRREREQHALLVVADDARRARGQHQLAAVGVDVGLEEADLLLVDARAGRSPRARRARRRPRSGPSRAMQLVGAARSAGTRRSRCGARAAGRRPATCARTRSRQAPGDLVARPRRRRTSRGEAQRSTARRRGQQQARSLGGAQAAARAAAIAVAGLSRMSPAPAAFSIATTAVAAGPARSSSRCDSPTRNRWNSPLCMPCDMRRVDVPRRRAQPADVPQRAAHAEGRVGTHGPHGPRPRRAAAARRRRASAGRRRCSSATPSSALEGAIDRLRQLLGPLASAARAGRSDSFVKPEMSAKTTVASCGRTRAPAGRPRAGAGGSAAHRRRAAVGRRRALPIVRPLLPHRPRVSTCCRGCEAVSPRRWTLRPACVVLVWRTAPGSAPCSSSSCARGSIVIVAVQPPRASPISDWPNRPNRDVRGLDRRPHSARKTRRLRRVFL